MCSFVVVFLMHGICVAVICELGGLGLGLGVWFGNVAVHFCFEF